MIMYDNENWYNSAKDGFHASNPWVAGSNPVRRARVQRELPILDIRQALFGDPLLLKAGKED